MFSVGYYTGFEHPSYVICQHGLPYGKSIEYARYMRSQEMGYPNSQVWFSDNEGAVLLAYRT